MEIGGRLLSLFVPFQVLYRENKNAAMEHVIHHGRNRFTQKAIPRDNLLGMRKSLRQNMPVWYAPDQDFGIGKGVFAPFFGIPAATITATSTLAKMAQSPVVPFYQTRLPGARGYRLTLLPALENFPGADIEADTRRINALIETWIREQPEQYLWAHRRFKTRPEGSPPLYQSGSR
jgi:KDO2-lipid IV(A) lauroyltransferase